MSGLAILVLGACLVCMGWWMSTHEHWASRIDREAYESRPSRLRYWNHRFSKVLNRWIVPLAMTALGLVAIGVGISRLWRGLR
jgi:hypothetical protein